MAGITAAVIGGVAAVGGAAMQANASKNAANAQGRAADASIAEQRRQFDLIRSDNAPYQQVGTGALGQLATLYGIKQTPADTRALGTGIFKPSEVVNMLNRGNTVDEILKLGVLGSGQGSKEIRYLQQSGLSSDDINRLLNGKFSPLTSTPGDANAGASGEPDYSAFYNSPDYKFALQQGSQVTERSAAAKGGLNSGNTLAALTQFGQGLATQNLNNYTNRLASLVGVGQTANSSNASAGLATGANVGNALMAAGSARASGITDAANAWGNAAGDIAGITGNYLRTRQLNKTPSYMPTYGQVYRGDSL